MFVIRWQRLGTAGRLWVVVVSNALASPLAVGVLLAPYPWCFICLLGAELLGEMRVKRLLISPSFRFSFDLYFHEV